MTKQEIKNETLRTLEKVEPVTELPAFILMFKMQTFFRLILGEIPQETADIILETIKEFWGE